MKKFLYALPALVAFCLMVPGVGSAQHVFYNQLGMYLTSDGTGGSSTFDVGVPITVFLVLTNPADVNNGNVPISGLTCFDCQLNFYPIGNIFKIGDALNGDGFNIGDAGHIELGFLEYIVGFADEVPAVNDAVLLTSLQFINNNVVEVQVTLGPASYPSIPGTMSYCSPQQTQIEMYPASGDYADPVFTFNGSTVPVESGTFGSVKGLYR